VVVQTTADICSDAGEGALASKVELLGRAEQIGDGKLIVDLVIGIGIQNDVDGAFGRGEIFQILLQFHGETSLIMIAEIVA